MTTQKLFICKNCGNIVVQIHDGGGKLVCCGMLMKELTANTVDAAKEKHVPVVCVEGNKVCVTVGSALHPMLAAHYIQWIYLETTHGGHCWHLAPDDEPKAEFVLAEGEKPLAAYEYCNLHGLWKAEVR